MNFEEYIELVNKKLDEYMCEDAFPQDIFKSMKYTVTLKGKRLRPVMCLEACRIFGGNIEDALPTACAIEMLHAQTLIHDDLPCMDNDDFRRGKPTNHKVFGEATAVLAGDALISFAPQVILENSKNLSAETLVRIMKEYVKFAGAYGVIGGQVADIEAEKNWKNNKFGLPPEELLEFIHSHKTADLFKLPLRCGAIIAGASEADLTQITDFAQKLGVAFQISDDILDEISTFEEMGKTIGKDKTADKLTYVSLYGLDASKEKLACILEECCAIIDALKVKSEVLKDIIRGIEKRVGI